MLSAPKRVHLGAALAHTHTSAGHIVGRLRECLRVFQAQVGGARTRQALANFDQYIVALCGGWRERGTLMVKVWWQANASLRQESV